MLPIQGTQFYASFQYGGHLKVTPIGLFFKKSAKIWTFHPKLAHIGKEHPWANIPTFVNVKYDIKKVKNMVCELA